MPACVKALRDCLILRNHAQNYNTCLVLCRKRCGCPSSGVKGPWGSFCAPRVSWLGRHMRSSAVMRMWVHGAHGEHRIAWGRMGCMAHAKHGISWVVHKQLYFSCHEQFAPGSALPYTICALLDASNSLSVHLVCSAHLASFPPALLLAGAQG